MARSHEPANGSDHPHHNGITRRRFAIALFIMATFGIAAVVSFPLARNIQLPLRFPRPLQAALSPAERLIRPIIPWLGPISPPASPPRALAARPRATLRPAPSRHARPGPVPPQPVPPTPPPLPPPPSPPPGPPPPGPPWAGKDTVRRKATTRPPRAGKSSVAKPPSSILPDTQGAAPSLGERTVDARHLPGHRQDHGGLAPRRHSHEHPAKHAKHGKHAQHAGRAKHRKHAGHGTHKNRAGKR